MRPDTQSALRGMTWNHPRGFDPLVACSREWRERTGVEISWERRSLQDFESFPVQRLARQYDLIVIDHPHVGQITREQCLLPLDGAAHERQRAAIAQNSVGGSFQSYVWQGRLWALPIDAAAQVQALRPDRLEAPAADWSTVLQLARQGRVQCPMRPPHNLMSLYTLCGQLGPPGQVEGPELLDPQTAIQAYEMLRELISHLHPACFSMDPIAVFEAMSEQESPIACVPLIYGYVSYAREEFRQARIAFADIPVLRKGAPPVGSALGGTGIAVSAHASQPDAAMDFAYWISSAQVQKGLYAAHGGQPGNAAAWNDEAVNGPVFGFYRATQATLAGSWVRPRHDGYMHFQDVAAERLLAALRANEPPDATVTALNRLFRASLNNPG
jgi:multiple sugar transport system substrate-binding protein